MTFDIWWNSLSVRPAHLMSFLTQDNTDNKTTQKDSNLPPFSEWLQICDSSVWTDQNHVATMPDVECGGKQNIT